MWCGRAASGRLILTLHLYRNTRGEERQKDVAVRGGDRKKGSKVRKEKGNRERVTGAGRAEIAELIVRVSTRKPSQDSHSAKC